MATTQAGATLTAAHRDAQLALRARFVREFLRLADMWRGDARTFATLVAAAIPLVQLRNRDSSTLAAQHFEAFRRAELGAAARGVTVSRADVPAAETIAAGMWAAGQNQVAAALRAGLDERATREAALVRVSGATSRNVLNGGRNTTLRNVAADPQARGWQRVTGGSPCAFCVMLASRGPVYKSESSADFQAHAADNCSAEAVYASGASAWSDQALQHRATYQRAQREARAAGDLDRGTSNDALNALRRTLNA